MGEGTSIRSGTVAMVTWPLEEGWVETLPNKWYSCYGGMAP